MRRLKEIIAEFGANSEEVFREAEAANLGTAFKEQAERWFKEIQTRKRRPIKPRTANAWATYLLKHKWQSCRLNLVPEISCPLIAHCAASALVLQFSFPVCRRVPQILVSRSALPASYKPMEAVKVYVLGNVLKQRFRTDPADNSGYSPQHVHFIEGPSGARRDTEPYVGVAIVPIMRKALLNAIRALGQNEPNKMWRAFDNVVPSGRVGLCLKFEPSTLVFPHRIKLTAHDDELVDSSGGQHESKKSYELIRKEAAAEVLLETFPPRWFWIVYGFICSLCGGRCVTVRSFLSFHDGHPFGGLLCVLLGVLSFALIFAFGHAAYACRLGHHQKGVVGYFEF